MAITLQQAQELTQQPIDFISNFWQSDLNTKTLTITVNNETVDTIMALIKENFERDQYTKLIIFTSVLDENFNKLCSLIEAVNEKTKMLKEIQFSSGTSSVCRRNSLVHFSLMKPERIIFFNSRLGDSINKPFFLSNCHLITLAINNCEIDDSIIGELCATLNTNFFPDKLGDKLPTYNESSSTYTKLSLTNVITKTSTTEIEPFTSNVKPSDKYLIKRTDLLKIRFQWLSENHPRKIFFENVQVEIEDDTSKQTNTQSLRDLCQLDDKCFISPNCGGELYQQWYALHTTDEASEEMHSRLKYYVDLLQTIENHNHDYWIGRILLLIDQHDAAFQFFINTPISDLNYCNARSEAISLLLSGKLQDITPDADFITSKLPIEVIPNQIAQRAAAKLSLYTLQSLNNIKPEAKNKGSEQQLRNLIMRILGEYAYGNGIKPFQINLPGCQGILAMMEELRESKEQIMRLQQALVEAQRLEAQRLQAQRLEAQILQAQNRNSASISQQSEAAHHPQSENLGENSPASSDVASSSIPQLPNGESRQACLLL